MIYVVIIYLWMSILLYVLLGGADFGTGIIELFTIRRYRTETRTIMYKAISPIWEANHMWLIIVVVILFVGFPATYTNVAVHLHIPLFIMLLGIIARGTAMTFRNYDAVTDRMQQLYTCIFIGSSFIVPLFSGIIAGSLISGKMYANGNSFSDVYVYNWLNWLSVATGLFTISLFGFIASVFLIAQTDEPDERERALRMALKMNMALILTAFFVYITAGWLNIPLLEQTFGSVEGILNLITFLLCLTGIWFTVLKKSIMGPRIFTGLLVAEIFFWIINEILLKNVGYLSLMKNRSGDPVIHMLGLALLIGSFFILPPLFYLFAAFQKKGILLPEKK